MGTDGAIHISYGGTLIGCSPAKKFYEALKSAARVQIHDGQLTLLDDGGRELARFSRPTAKTLPTGPIAEVRAIADGIEAAGIGCDYPSFEAGPWNNTPGNPTVQQLSCNVGDDTVAISLFADHTALIQSREFVRQASCFVAHRQASNLTYIEGNNWIVFPEREATADRIVVAIGGALRKLDC